MIVKGRTKKKICPEDLGALRESLVISHPDQLEDVKRKESIQTTTEQEIKDTKSDDSLCSVTGFDKYWENVKTTKSLVSKEEKAKRAKQVVQNREATKRLKLKGERIKRLIKAINPRGRTRTVTPRKTTKKRTLSESRVNKNKNAVKDKEIEEKPVIKLNPKITKVSDQQSVLDEAVNEENRVQFCQRLNKRQDRASSVKATSFLQRTDNRLEDYKKSLPTAKLDLAEVLYTSAKSHINNPTGKCQPDLVSSGLPDSSCVTVVRQTMARKGRFELTLDYHKEVESLQLSTAKKGFFGASLNLDFQKQRSHPEQINLRILSFLIKRYPRGYFVTKVGTKDVCVVIGNLYDQFKEKKFRDLVKFYTYTTRFLRNSISKADGELESFILTDYNTKKPNIQPDETDKVKESITIFSATKTDWLVNLPHLLKFNCCSSMLSHALSGVVDYMTEWQANSTTQSFHSQRTRKNADVKLHDSSHAVNANSRVWRRRSDPDSSTYRTAHAKVLRDLLSYLNVQGNTTVDTTGVSLLTDLSPHVGEWSSVGRRHGKATVVDYTNDIEFSQRPKSESTHQSCLASFEANIKGRMSSECAHYEVTRKGKIIKKVEKSKNRDSGLLYVPKVHVENPSFEPIAELFYGTTDDKLIPIQTLLDTGARAERVLTACSLMSRWYFNKAIAKSPQSFRYIDTSQDQDYVTLIDGTKRVQVPARYYEFGLKAIDNNGRVVTDHLNIAVVDKCVDAYQLVLGIDQFRRIKPEFPEPEEPGNWIRFHGGPWRGMTVRSKSDHGQELGALSKLEKMPKISEEQKELVADYQMDTPTTVTMPSMTCVDVRIDNYLVEKLDELEDEQCYIIRLDPRALNSDLTALEVIITTEEIRALRSGLAKNLLVRINNLSKGKRTLHLEELFRVEKIGSNKLVFSLPGYRITQGEADDVFGRIGKEMDMNLTKEQVADMLDSCAAEFADELQNKSEISACTKKQVEERTLQPSGGSAAAYKDTFTWALKLAKAEKGGLNDTSYEKSYRPIPMLGSLSSSKVMRKPIKKLVERRTGNRCILLEPPGGKFQLTSEKWKKQFENLNYFTVFNDYEEKKFVGQPNRILTGAIDICQGQVLFLSEQKVLWEQQVVFMERRSECDQKEVKKQDKKKIQKLGGMSKNSYKHEKKKTEDACLEDELLKEIAEKKAKVMAQKPINTTGKDWKIKVETAVRERYSSKLKKDLESKPKLQKEFEKEFFDNAECYHEEGCPTPEYLVEKAGVLKKENATWKVLPYFNLSHLDAVRLSWIVSEEVRKGNLVKWEPGMELPLHASPAFIAARKGHLTGRMVVDFRVYNQQIKLPCFSMPNSEDILADLTDGDAAYYGASDLATGYFHAQLKESELPFLAITTKEGMYFSKKLQLGPSWAPAWFQSRSRSAFPPEFHIYIDDILFKAKSAEELLERIRTIHQSCRKTGFVLSLKKTYYGVTEVDALGHTITTEGRCAAQGKVDLIQNWKFPESVQNLKSFVCVLVYLRDYIWRFAEKVYPLKKYLRGKDPTPISELAGDSNAQRAIQLLKNSIATKATIRHIDRKAASDYKNSGRPVIIYADASQYAKSFVICQKPSRDKAPQIAVYKSRSFSETERKWSTLERELNAILYLVEEGIRYIEGVPAILLFDHKNLGETELQSIWVNKQKSDKISRWCDRIIGALQKLQIRRHYLPGQLNLLADVGSRYGHDTNRDQTDIPSNVKDLVKTLFNTTDSDAKNIEELVKTAEKEFDENNFKKVAENYNSLGSVENRLAALAVFSRLAASKFGKEEEQEYKEESKIVFDDEMKNKATQKAYSCALHNYDVSEWRDRTHYAEEEYYHENSCCAMKTGIESDIKFSVTQALTKRGFSFQNKISGGDLGLIKEGIPVKVYNHWETYEKTPDRSFKTKKKDPEEKKKEIIERSLTDPKWSIVFKKEQKGEEIVELILKSEATEAQIVLAKEEARDRAIQDLRRQILDTCPEPSSGRWHILQLDLKEHPSRAISRWRSNYALGPIEKLEPKRKWELDEIQRMDNSHEFKIYKLKESEQVQGPVQPSKDPAIGGRDNLDEELEEYPDGVDSESDDEIFEGLDPEQIDASSDQEEEVEEDVNESKDEDIGNEQVDEKESTKAKFPVKKLKTIEGTVLEPELAKLHKKVKEKERLRREACAELYADLQRIILENSEEVWDRDAGCPEWQEETDTVFKVIDYVIGSEHYNRVQLLDNSSDCIPLHPRRVYKIVLLTTENGAPKIFPAMGTVHFSSSKHQLKFSEFLENINSQPETEGHKFTCALVFSRETQLRDQKSFFSKNELKRLGEAQRKCKETKWKLGFLDRTRDEGEEWLRKNLTKAQVRVENLDRKQNHFEVKKDLLYMNHRLVIPRCLTSEVYGEGKDESGKVRAKFLRTHLIGSAHRYNHDNQTTRTKLADEWMLNWPRYEKDIFEYEQRCLFCIVEKPVPKHTSSYVSEIYSERNHTWFIDHQGPFGPRGHKYYLLTVIDDASGRVWIDKTSNKNVATVTKYLEVLFQQCDPYRIPAQVSVYGTPDTGAPSVPQRIRADNGFGAEVTNCCRQYAGKFNMAYTPAFIAGTAENPTGQHRVERPHRAFRKWVNALHIEQNGDLFKDPDVAVLVANYWNHRPIFGKFTPFECYYGLPPPFKDCDLDTANDYRNQSRLQLISELTALRQARSSESHQKHLKKHGLVETVFSAGELAVLAHLSAKRKSKQSYLSNYRFQIFRVERNRSERDSKYNRVYLTPAIGDRSILFKQPVNIKKLRKVPDIYGDYLEFEAPPSSTATERFCDQKRIGDLIDTDEVETGCSTSDDSETSSDSSDSSDGSTDSE